MNGKPLISVMPDSGNSILIKGLSDRMDRVLPTLGIRTFNHSFEITVTDLAGDIVHVVVIRQNGDIEVDK
jgi:hypothetical protein